MTVAQPEAARARAMVYHALAEALAQPMSEIEELVLDATMAGARVLGSAACQQAVLALTLEPRSRGAEERGSGGRSPCPPVSLSPCLSVSSSPCLPVSAGRPVVLYESLHRQGCLAGQITWEVEAYYRALGLAPLDGELPDHASVELACLGYLAAAEAEARTVGDGRLVARLRAEQRAFLRTHAGTWLPEVGAALATIGDPFYAIVGRLLSDFLSEELTGRRRARQAAGTRLPTLRDPAACTLCGLCVGSCLLGALRVVESPTETALTLNPQQCVGCDRCVRICPEEVLSLASDSRSRPANGAGRRVMRRSARATCPNCNKPTVSQAELNAVFARLQPDPATRHRLSLCVECKSLY